MKVTLKIYGFPGLYQAFGGQKVDIEFKGKTVRDLVVKLIKTYGQEAKKAILDNDGRLNSSVRLLKNGRQWINEEDLDTDLIDGDVIVLALLVTGG